MASTRVFPSRTGSSMMLLIPNRCREPLEAVPVGTMVRGWVGGLSRGTPTS